MRGTVLDEEGNPSNTEQQQPELTAYCECVKSIFSVGSPFIIQAGADAGNKFLITYLISRLGHTQLAASGLVNAVFNTVTAIDTALLVPLSSLIAIQHSRKNSNTIGALAQYGWLLSISLALPAMGIYLAIKPILLGFKQDPKVVELVNSYFFPYSFSVIAARWNDVNTALLAATERQKALSIIRILTNIIGVGCTFLLVYDTDGLPALGMKGAGLAMLIQKWSSLIITFFYIKFIGDFSEYRLFEFRYKQNIPLLKEMLNVSVPVFVLSLLKAPVSFLETIFVGWLSIQALELHTISEIFSSSVAPPMVGIIMGTGILVAQKFGERFYADMRRHANVAYALLVSLSLLPIIIFIFASNHLFHVFTSQSDPEILDLMRDVLVVDSVKHLIDNVGEASNRNLMGVLDTFTPAMVKLLDAYLLYLPLAYGIGKAFGSRGVLGVHLGVALGIIVYAGILLYRWYDKSKDVQFLEGERGTRVRRCFQVISDYFTSCCSECFEADDNQAASNRASSSTFRFSQTSRVSRTSIADDSDLPTGNDEMSPLFAAEYRQYASQS